MPTAVAFSPLVKIDSNVADANAVRDNISAIALFENNLWVGGDEGTRIHRFSRNGEGDYTNHRFFNIAEVLNLPDQGSDASEIDVEGLYVDGGLLWVVGSHSLKREKPKPNKTAVQNISRMAEVAGDGNRFTLGRLPLIPNGADFDLPLSPAAGVARLEGDAAGNLLTRALSSDPHLGPFVPHKENGRRTGIPSKDNGFDIEGLAVRGNRIFVGLRGPVLRGWAIVLELEMKDAHVPGTLQLKKIGPDGALYRKHFLQLEGLGVRDLIIDGDALYILAGPSMELDGPVCVFRWDHALSATSESVVWRNELSAVLTIPFGTGADRGRDHAEGLALNLSAEGNKSLMVAYDSPAKSRIDENSGVRLDVFNI